MSGSAATGNNFNHRSEYHRAWSRLTPPVVPNAEVAAAVKEQLGDVRGRALLLGVTPLLAGVGEQMIAVDRNHSMVANIWPGNGPARKAIVADWQGMPFFPETFSACVGDGSLCALQRPHQHARLFVELGRVLKPGAKFVCRVFAMPDVVESVDAVRDAALAGSIRHFHAFKWRLAMSLASETANANIPVRAVHAAFKRMFRDRDDLLRITGWERNHVDTIDFYENSISGFSYASRQQLMDVASNEFVNIGFVDCGTYELAERCPLLVMERR